MTDPHFFYFLRSRASYKPDSFSGMIFLRYAEARKSESDQRSRFGGVNPPRARRGAGFVYHEHSRMISNVFYKLVNKTCQM